MSIQEMMASAGVGALVVVVGIAIEVEISRRRDTRARRQNMLLSLLGDYLFAIARNVRAAEVNDLVTVHESGARVLATNGQLLVFGTGRSQDALSRFKDTGMNMGTAEGQDALLSLLQTLRNEVFPGEERFDENLARKLMFEGSLDRRT